MKKLRGEKLPVVLCSAGDFYGTADEFNKPKSQFVARMMGYLHYDAVGLGEMDLNYGLPTLMDDARTNDLPVTCANIVAKGKLAESIREEYPDTPRAAHGTVFPPYLVVERDGLRVGFVSLLSPSTRAVGKTGDLEAITYTVRDPLEVAKTIIPEARAACDVLVLLAHMPRMELDSLLTQFPQVEIAVVGHEARTTSIGTPEKVGEALVVKATSQGQNVGDLTVTVDADDRIADANNHIYFLSDGYKDDPEVVKMLDEFDVENRKIQKVLYAKAQLRQARNPDSGRYLGVGTCQSCHADAFDVYRHTRHAHAYQTLAEQFVHRDTNCVGCHVTGWEQEGGFSGVRYRGSRVDLSDVQCEACHGPGYMHSRDGSYAQAAVESCTRCHTKNDDPDFDFATDWPKIAH